MKERIETHLKCLQLINAIQSPIFRNYKFEAEKNSICHLPKKTG